MGYSCQNSSHPNSHAHSPTQADYADPIYAFVPQRDDQRDSQVEATADRPTSFAIELPPETELPPPDHHSSLEIQPFYQNQTGYQTGQQTGQQLLSNWWEQLAAQVLTPDYLTQLIAQLQAQSPGLTEIVTRQLFAHLMKVYRHKVAQVLEQEGTAAINLKLPQFNLVVDRPTQTRRLELIWDEEKLRSHLHQSLTRFLAQGEFWQDLARTVGTHLIMGVVERSPTRLTSAAFTNGIDPLDPFNPFNPLDPLDPSIVQSVRDGLIQTEAAILTERLQFFVQIYAPEIGQKIVNGFDLPHCSLAQLDGLLGLKRSLPIGTELRFDLDAIALMPTSIPMISSIRAQLRPDLWQQDNDDRAVFRYRSRINPNNYIEHYIANPGDIDLLPWEAADQIIDKFGFDTVKLQMIFAARTMEEDEPWNSTFTLKATDMVKLLGWDRNHSLSLPEKRNAIAVTAYALSCLLVKSVWVEGRGRWQVDASVPVGRMWDVLIDTHGQIDWLTGKIEKPDEVYITVRPGLWTKHFLNRAGSKAKEALHQFGYLAKDILQIDPYHHEMALRLAIQLSLDARVRARNQNPYDYRVLGLMEEVLPKTEIERSLADKYRARDLKNRWNKSLLMLMQLGWQIEFDPVTYPEWLRPGSAADKPEDWRKVRLLDRLLQARLTIKPPDPIPQLLSRVHRSPKKSKALVTLSRQAIAGDDILRGRTARGWSRKELGGFLGLSADYVGKLERGDRFLTPELEGRLRKLLRL